MSDIPYSVRDKNVRVNAIKGFNFADIKTNEMFKKVDDNNVGGTDVFSEQTSTTNKLSILAGTGILTQTVGTIEGVTDLSARSLHMNTFGDRNRGITIFDNGTSFRVGIGITEPEEDLEIDGSVQIDSANVARLKFQKSGNPARAHALGEIDGEEDLTNGGNLQFFTKVDNGSVTEKLRINNVGAVGIGGATYGDAGAVLTSNGSGAAVSWTRPYFIKAKLTGDYRLTGANGTARVLTMSAVDFGTGFDYNGTTDWANDEWSCPQTGVYRVSLQLGVQSTVVDRAYYAAAILELKRGATTSYIYRNELSTYIDDDTDQVYLTGTTINRFEQGDDLRLIIGWAVVSGTVKARGDSGEDQTFLIIERII